jgi:DNA replication protein DnaC
MLIEETLQKMLALKMPAMARATRELIESAASNQLSFEDRLGFLIDREWTERDGRRVARRIREAKISTSASLEAIDCDAARGLDKSFIKLMTTCSWVSSHHNVLVTGATGTGKSFLGAALAEVACRHGFRALFVRVPRLVEDLALARASGSYTSTLGKLSRVDVLVLDDFLLAPMKDSERRDVLEVLEDRYERSSTVITSQLPSKTWHSALNDPTIADAICDRLVHNAHLVELRGPSMRKKKSLDPVKH